MDQSFINELDGLYISYGYEPRTSKSIRIYLFTKSIYNGADIIRDNNKHEVEELRKQYSELGYEGKTREIGLQQYITTRKL